MTVGSLPIKIFVFSLPLIASNLIQVLFNLSDIAVVGKAAGGRALGAVGSTTILVGLFVGFLIGLGGGINVRVARHIGAKDREKLYKTVPTSLFVALFFGILISLLGILFARNILSLLGTKEELLEGAVLYFRIYLIGLPFTAIYDWGQAVYSAGGETGKPLLFLLISGISNVVMNLFFVLVCGMEEDGVALASAISQVLAAVLVTTSLLRCPEEYALKPKRICFDPVSAKDVIVIGVPGGLQNAIFALANLFIQSAVNTFDTLTVEGNAAATNADSLVYDVMNAFYIACASFMGQNFGAKKKKRVLRSYFISLFYSFLIGGILGLSFVLAGKNFLFFFTSDPAIAEAGLTRLRIMGFSYAFSSFMDCTIAASRGLGKSLHPTLIVILGSCVFRVAWVYTVFAYFRTLKSLYLLYIFSWSITAIAEIIYFIFAYRSATESMPSEP